MTYAISSADSNVVNVTILNNCETESSKFASSDVQNTAFVAESTTHDGDQSVSKAEASGISMDCEQAGADFEPRARLSTTSSPVRLT